MRPFRHADEVLWRYLELKRNLYSIKAVNPIEREAFVYPDKCPECRSRLRHPTIDGGQACGKCGEALPLTLAPLLKREIQRTRVHADFRMHLISQADQLERILHLDAWDRRIYLETFLYERRTFLGAAFHARQRWAGHSHDLTDKKVRGRIERARRIVNDRLRERGLLLV